MAIICVAKDFSETPGARYTKDGPFSGEEFRKTCLEPLFGAKGTTEEVIVILDGVEGFATSFLEEAFGGLARLHGKAAVLARLQLISNEDPLLKEEILGYIRDAEGAEG